MRVLVDICHPAHVHFFKNIIHILKEHNHEIFVTSRDKDVTLNLLNELSIDHECISKAPNSKSLFGFVKEIIVRESRLYRITQQFKPDVMIAIGGIFIAHVGLITKSKTIVCYDTENAILQNLLTYPFTNLLLVPRAYKSWTPQKRTIRYNGYHELSYLHSNYFNPNKTIASTNGINFKTENFFLRIVSWQANHDINEAGWTNEFLDKIITELSGRGNIIISSERSLPKKYHRYLYQGESNKLHDVLAFCNLYIGESATIASEAAVLGVPAMYIANTSRGYIDEQEELYNLVKVINNFDFDHIKNCLDEFLGTSKDTIKERHENLKNSCLDVAQFVYKQICST